MTTILLSWKTKLFIYRIVHLGNLPKDIFEYLKHILSLHENDQRGLEMVFFGFQCWGFLLFVYVVGPTKLDGANWTTHFFFISYILHNILFECMFYLMHMRWLTRQLGKVDENFDK